MRFVKIKSGNKVISKKTKLLETHWEHSVGLMFRKKGEVLMKLDSESKIMTTIHTFFCAPSIVAWLDKNLKVVDVKRTKPFWFYEPKKPAMYVFETTDLKKKIKIGEKWRIIFL